MRKSNLPKLIFIGSVLLLILIINVQGNRQEDYFIRDEVEATAVSQADALNAFNIPNLNLAIIKAPVFLAQFLDSSEKLTSKNFLLYWPLASITKLMSAVVVMENLEKNQPISITEDAVSEEGVAGNFRPGEVFSATDLWRAMIAVSSNDAAAALANFYNATKGDPKAFAEAMNLKALGLEMDQTRFADPTGLSVLNQSTAEDLVKLVRYIYGHHPEILAVSRQPEVEIIDLKSKIKRVLRNINAFAGQPDFIGGKTGFIDEANGNLVSLFDHNGRPVIIVIFGSDDRFGETKKIYQSL